MAIYFSELASESSSRRDVLFQYGLSGISSKYFRDALEIQRAVGCLVTVSVWNRVNMTLLHCFHTIDLESYGSWRATWLFIALHMIEMYDSNRIQLTWKAKFAIWCDLSLHARCSHRNRSRVDFPAHNWAVITKWATTQCQWIPKYSFSKWRGTQLLDKPRLRSTEAETKMNVQKCESRI